MASIGFVSREAALGEALHLLQHISTEFNVKLGTVADKVNLYASLTDPLEHTE